MLCYDLQREQLSGGGHFAKLDLLSVGTITLLEVSYSTTIPISILQLHWRQHPNRWGTCKGSNTWNPSCKMDFDTWCIG